MYGVWRLHIIATKKFNTYILKSSNELVGSISRKLRSILPINSRAIFRDFFGEKGFAGNFRRNPKINSNPRSLKVRYVRANTNRNVEDGSGSSFYTSLGNFNNVKKKFNFV